MAKKKKVDGGVASALASISATKDQGTQGLLDEALVESFKILNDQGIECLSSEESTGRLICLQMPALAPRFLFSVEGLPLGRLYLVAGAQESCKSALLAEMGTWHAAQGGYYHVFETEQKDAAGLRNSFFKYQKGKWGASRAFTQDEWNRQFFRFTERMRAMMDGGTVEIDGKKVKKKGTGRIAPIQIGVDSISAVTIEKFSEKTQEEGAPTMNHPLHAKMLSDFLKEAPKLLVDFPITMFMVSHEKFSSNPAAPHIQVRNTSGGMAPKYQVTTDISMKRLDKHQQKRIHPIHGEIYSIPLGMKVHKNSVGMHQNIEVEMCWYFDKTDIDPVHNEPRQKSYFDWHSATIELLKECFVAGKEGKEFGGARAKQLRDFIHFEDGDDRTISIPELDINDPIPYRDAGEVLEARIQSDPTFATELYSLMGIRRQFMFKKGVDMREQIKENIARVQDMDKTRDLSPQGAPPAVVDPDALEEPPPGV